MMLVSAAALAQQSELPISVDAASSDVDYKRNTVVFRDVVISQGPTRVAAERAEATGLDFEDSTWSFTGNVRITMEGGSLTSNSATVNFRDNEIAKATITGSPAKFEQELERSDTTARGRAETIEYDLGANRVRLARNAWLSDGRNEISGEELVYSLTEERVQAQAKPGENDRVRITIRPQDRNGEKKEGAQGGPPAPQDEPPPGEPGPGEPPRDEAP